MANQPASSYFYTTDNPQCSVTSGDTNGVSDNSLNARPFIGNSQVLFQQNNQIVGSQSLAIASVHKIKELQRKYHDLRNIVLIIKKMLSKHNLNKPFSGGLNSYSIVLMTSTFLEKFGINHCSALS